MAKTKERNELEHLRAENRKLTAELRRTKRELSRQAKKSDRIEDLEAMVIEQSFDNVSEELDADSKCPKCNKGTIESVDLGIRVLRKCTNCNFRETKK